MSELLHPVLEYEAAGTGRHGTRWRRREGTRIDLHCHSRFSDETIRYLPGVQFHPLLEPDQIYDLAKSRGMDFVTLTDHDTIDGCKALLDARGDLADFIIGEEVSCMFPEDGTIIHVNVYDIDEAQHAEIQRLRKNLYDVVHYIESVDKLFVLNHMTWTEQHRVLKTWQIEAMLRLFPIFEGINGTRSYAHNAFAWYATQGHGKTLVAGSDSHTNRMGLTYTLTEGRTSSEVIAAIRAGRASACGAFGTPEQLRDDVWTLIQKNIERKMAEASSAWERMTCRVVRRVGRLAYPVVCLGYHKRQNQVIRESLQALPT